MHSPGAAPKEEKRSWVERLRANGLQHKLHHLRGQKEVSYLAASAFMHLQWLFSKQQPDKKGLQPMQKSGIYYSCGGLAACSFRFRCPEQSTARLHAPIMFLCTKQLNSPQPSI